MRGAPVSLRLENQNFHQIMNASDPNTEMIYLIGENVAGFIDLYNVVEPALILRRKSHRPAIDIMDQLMMLLCYYHHYPLTISLAATSKSKS